MGAIMGDCQGCCGGMPPRCGGMPSRCGGMNCIFHPSGINGIEGSLPLVPMMEGRCGAVGLNPPAAPVAPVVQSIPEYPSALIFGYLLSFPLSNAGVELWVWVLENFRSRETVTGEKKRKRTRNNFFSLFWNVTPGTQVCSSYFR